MNSSLLSHCFLLISLVIMAFAFFFIGFTILGHKKPLIINSRWYLLILFPLLLLRITSESSLLTDVTGIFLVIITFALMGYLFYKLKGYYIFGADREDFEKVLIESLREKNYEFEQTISSINIKNPALQISVNFQYSRRSGSIKMLNNENEETFKEIIRDLKEKNIKPDTACSFLYIGLGVLITGFVYLIKF